VVAVVVAVVVSSLALAVAVAPILVLAVSAPNPPAVPVVVGWTLAASPWSDYTYAGTPRNRRTLRIRRLSDGYSRRPSPDGHTTAICKHCFYSAEISKSGRGFVSAHPGRSTTWKLASDAVFRLAK
jgi:hypothetical protein